jgi:hypothetical protein
MPLRELKDLDGRVWQVWESRPGPAAADSAEGRYFESQASKAGEPITRFTAGRSGGWVTFTCGDERRRLSPIPADWHTASDAQLRNYLAEADQVRSSAWLDSISDSDADTKRGS